MEYHEQIKAVVDLALEEDIRSGDITSDACIPENANIFGRLILKESGIVAGLPFLAYAFAKLSDKIEFNSFTQDGTHHHAGTVLGTLSGPASSVMAAERTALNLVQHASGIATKTSHFAHLVTNFNCKILDTRRTLPGLRALEQYSVLMGGGTPYRKGLDDRFMIKKHHLAFIARKTHYPVKEAIQKVRAANPEEKVEIEICSEEFLDQALETGVDLVVLDHMHPDQVRRCVKKAQVSETTVYVECTGMITPETIRNYAETGIDGIIISDLALAPTLEIRLLKSL